MSETRWPWVSCRPAWAVVLSVLLIHLTLLSTGVAWGQTTGTHYRGETVFRGLFFGTGPIAKKFPEIWEDPMLLHYNEALNNKPELVRKLNELRNKLVKRIAKKDPDFFQRFGEDIQSGDHLIVQAAVEDASTRLVEAMSAELGFDVTNPEAIPTNSADSKCVFVIVGVVVAAAVVAAAALATVVFVYTVVTEVKFAPMLVEPDEKARLQTEMWVDLIANRLAPSYVGAN
jgi:cannibalism toxin, SdpC family